MGFLSRFAGPFALIFACLATGDYADYSVNTNEQSIFLGFGLFYAFVKTFAFGVKFAYISPCRNSYLFGRCQLSSFGVFFYQISCFGGHFGGPKPSGEASGRHREKSSNFDTSFLAILANFDDFGVPPGGLQIDQEPPAPKDQR